MDRVLNEISEAVQPIAISRTFHSCVDLAKRGSVFAKLREWVRFSVFVIFWPGSWTLSFVLSSYMCDKSFSLWIACGSWSGWWCSVVFRNLTRRLKMWRTSNRSRLTMNCWSCMLSSSRELSGMWILVPWFSFISFGIADLGLGITATWSGAKTKLYTWNSFCFCGWGKCLWRPKSGL